MSNDGYGVHLLVYFYTLYIIQFFRSVHQIIIITSRTGDFSTSACGTSSLYDAVWFEGPTRRSRVRNVENHVHMVYEFVQRFRKRILHDYCTALANN